MRPEPRIVSGRISQIDQYPYLVVLELDFKHRCGGSIISPNIIITAAHCLKNATLSKHYQVRAGSRLKEREGTVHYVRNFSRHPEYGKLGPSYHGIAILKLENPVELGNKTKKLIKLFKSGEKSKDGAKVMTAGWGLNGYTLVYGEELQDLQMVIVGKEKCSKIWLDQLKVGMICASSPIDNVNGSTCSGDSGGPLVVNNKLTGVVSAGADACVSRRRPAIFTEIAYMRK